ncbi:MAG: PAS domain-containing protein [Candidatus Latescibacteria bacterium]|nr:PAS domain-containing protein [Candidatus Latescibacterota bacterium]
MPQLKTIQVINCKEAELLRLHRSLLDASPDLIAIIGIDFKFRYVNAAYADIHKQSAQDLIGTHVRDFLGDEIFTTVVKPNLVRCLDGEDVRYEAWFDFGDSKIFYMDVHYLPLHNSSDVINRVAIITRDISSIKEVEKTRIHEEKQRTIMELAATYNHAINNPLCALSLYLELLKENETDKNKNDLIDKALFESKRISEILDKVKATTCITLTDYPGGPKILDISRS